MQIMENNAVTHAHVIEALITKKKQIDATNQFISDKKNLSFIYKSSLDYFIDDLLTIEDKKKFYVAPKDFRNEYNLSVKLNNATPKLLEYFEKIARGLSRKFPYANKQDQDAHVAYAVSEAWRKWRKYDPTRTNSIFAFFTSTIRNDMAYNSNCLNKNKHQNISIDSLFVNMTDM